jgi:hypothetical protein
MVQTRASQKLRNVLQRLLGALLVVFTLALYIITLVMVCFQIK